MSREPIKQPLVLSNGGKLLVVWTNGGRRRTNVYGFSGTLAAPVSPASVATLQAAIRSAFSTSGFQAACGAAWGFSHVEVLDLNAANNAAVVGTDATLAGTDTGNLLPTEVAACVTLRTARAGALYRGRSYLSGWTVTANDASGAMGPTVEPAARLFVTGVKDALTASGWTLGVISLAYPLDPDNGKPAKPISIEPVTTITVRDVFWDTQRRRGIG